MSKVGLEKQMASNQQQLEEANFKILQLNETIDHKENQLMMAQDQLQKMQNER